MHAGNKMVCQDDPNSPGDDGGDFEIPRYRDNPGDANECDIDQPAVQSISGRSSRCKALLALFFLAALAVGGWEYYDYGQGGSGRGSSSNWVSDLEDPNGSLFPKKVRARGSDREEDDSVDHETSAHHEPVAENKQEAQEVEVPSKRALESK